MESVVLHKRSSLAIMTDVVMALLVRELKTRFGSSRLGYFWALAEPILQASVMAVIFTVLQRTSVNGIEIAPFLLVAVVPFKFFAKLLPQLTVAAQSNQALLAYRQVTPIDPLLTRFIIEVATLILVFVIIGLIMSWLGFNMWPQDLLALILVLGVLAWLGFGIGLCLCVAVIYWKDTTKLLSFVMAPMFFISGIFFAATMIPEPFWKYFTWNPIFHALELSRDAYFKAYETPVGDLAFIAGCALFFNALGLMLYQVNKHKFVSS